MIEIRNICHRRIHREPCKQIVFIIRDAIVQRELCKCHLTHIDNIWTANALDDIPGTSASCWPHAGVSGRQKTIRSLGRWMHVSDST